MNRFLKTAVLSAAVAATAVAPLSQAHAGKRRDGAPRQQTVVQKSNDGDALIAGIIGIAIGAIVVGAIASQEEAAPPPPPVKNPYRHPRPSIDRDVVYGEFFGWSEADQKAHYRQAQGGGQYGGSYEPWSANWYRYCANKYDNFDPYSGTYINRNGVEKFCTVKNR